MASANAGLRWASLVETAPCRAPMARALPQHRSDESNVRHQDSLSLSPSMSALCRRDVGGGASEVSQRVGRGGVLREEFEFVFAEVGNGTVSRLQGRAGGVEVVRRWSRDPLLLLLDNPVCCPIVQQKSLAHRIVGLEEIRGLCNARTPVGQLNCVLCDEGTWAGLRVAVCARSKHRRSQSSRVESLLVVRCLAAGWVMAETKS
jgi:hypothetical protein